MGDVSRSHLCTQPFRTNVNPQKVCSSHTVTCIANSSQSPPSSSLCQTHTLSHTHSLTHSLSLSLLLTHNTTQHTHLIKLTQLKPTPPPPNAVTLGTINPTKVTSSCAHLPFGSLGGGRVHEDPSVDQGPVDVRHHGPNVACPVRFATLLRGETDISV